MQGGPRCAILLRGTHFRFKLMMEEFRQLMTSEETSWSRVEHCVYVSQPMSVRQVE